MSHPKFLISDHFNGEFKSKFTQLIVNENGDFDFNCGTYGSHRKYVLL